MPSVLDQPTSLPAGARDVGDHPAGRGLAVGAGDRDDRDPRRDRASAPAPGSAAATRSAAALDRVLDVGAPGSASSTSATARPSAWARPRCRHGKATTSWCGSLVGRTRTASRAVPDSRGDRPHQPRRPRAARTAAGSPCPGAPGRALRSPIRRGEPQRPSSSGAAASAADVEGQLDRGAREVEVRALEDPQLDEGGHAGTLPSTASGQAPMAWKPPSTCTISPVVAGKKSRQQRARRPGRSARGRSRPSPAARGRSTSTRGPRSPGSPWRPGSSAGRRRPGCSGCPRGPRSRAR